MATKLRPLQKQISLVSGYSLLNYGDNIADALNELFFRFFNQTYYLHYQHEKLHQMLQINNNNEIETESITETEIDRNTLKVDDFLIDIIMKIHNDGKYLKKLTIVPCLKIHSPSNNYLSVVILYHILCFQTKTECKKVIKYNFNQQHSIKNMWNYQILKQSDCLKFNKLSFGIQFNILSIQYKTSPIIKTSVSVPVVYDKLNKEITIKWIINDELLDRIKQCDYGDIFYSDNFENDYFGLSLAPNGWNLGNKGITYLYLSLLKLPNGVKSMDVSHKTYYLDGDTFKWTSNINLESTFQSQIERTICNYSNILSLNSLTFKFKITINDIYDDMDRIIEHKRWPQFGIIANKQKLSTQKS